MNPIIEQIKQKVKSAFKDVESQKFLEKTIKNGVEKHRRNYEEFKTKNPNETFELWKTQVLLSINTNSTNNEEIIAMGIFLLALDEFEKEQT